MWEVLKLWVWLQLIVVLVFFFSLYTWRSYFLRCMEAMYLDSGLLKSGCDWHLWHLVLKVSGLILTVAWSKWVELYPKSLRLLRLTLSPDYWNQEVKVGRFTFHFAASVSFYYLSLAPWQLWMYRYIRRARRHSEKHRSTSVLADMRSFPFPCGCTQSSSIWFVHQLEYTHSIHLDTYNRI